MKKRVLKVHRASLRGKKRWNGEKGSVTMEFFGLFPFIFFAFLFVWQAGLAAYTIVVAETAARDGARVASVDGIGSTKIEEAIRQTAAGLKIEEIKVDYTPSDQAPEKVKVTVKVKVVNVELPIINQAISLDYTADAVIPYEEGMIS